MMHSVPYCELQQGMPAEDRAFLYECFPNDALGGKEQLVLDRLVSRSLNDQAEQDVRRLDLCRFSALEHACVRVFP